MPKSREAKHHGARPPHVAVLEKPHAGLRPGRRLFIASPSLLEARIRVIPPGETIEVATLRVRLAAEHGADATCSTSTAVFPRVVAERALQRPDDPAPSSRVMAPDPPLARKLSCGPDFIRFRRAAEGAQ